MYATVNLAKPLKSLKAWQLEAMLQLQSDEDDMTIYSSMHILKITLMVYIQKASSLKMRVVSAVITCEFWTSTSIEVRYAATVRVLLMK